MSGSSSRREEPGDGLLRPRWTAPAALAIAAVLAVASVAFLCVRRVTVARRFTGAEVEDLLQAEELEARSQASARILREYLLTGRRELIDELRAADSAVLDLLLRAAVRPDTGRVAATALAEDRRLQALRMEILGDPPRWPLDRESLRLFETEMVPARSLLDLSISEMHKKHAASFRAASTAFSIAERQAFWALTATAVAGLAVGAALVFLLRRSIEDLRASELRFRTTFERAPVGIAHVGLDGRLLRLNARYRDILGYTEQELRKLTFRDVVHPDDAGKDARQLERLLAGEIPGFAMERRFVRKDGREALVDSTASLVRDCSGHPWYLVMAVEDIGARKEMERQLREAVRDRDELMQMASHELRTPLTTLRLQVESLRAAAEHGGDLRKAIAKADAALRQVARVDALVDGLLDVARLDDASFSLRLERADLSSALRETVERLRPVAAREGVELHVDAPELLLAAFDRRRVDQALAALVSNAVKYGPGRPVDIRLEAVTGVARISVRDRGIGVDATERERIFGRFERAVSAHHYGGLGLGLFITRRIAEAHGGRVRVEAAPEQGSTFVIELPLGRAEAGEPLASGAGI